MPAHQDAFGSKTTCKHIKSAFPGGRDLVSSCESVCDDFNGYYPMMEKFMYMKCGDEGEFTNMHMNYICEQGFRTHPEPIEKVAR